MSLSRVHFAAGLLATLTIALFWVTTVVVEATNGQAAVVRVKSLIVVPGRFVLVPAIALTDASGFVLSRGRQTSSHRMTDLVGFASCRLGGLAAMCWFFLAWSEDAVGG